MTQRRANNSRGSGAVWLRAGLGVGLAAAVAGTLLNNLEQTSKTGAPVGLPAAEARQIEAKLPTGKPAPSVGTLAGLNGKKLSLDQYRGKVVVMDFWATWCGPCRAAIPVLQQVHTQYGRQGVVVLGVSDEEKSTVAPFAKKMGMTYTLAADPDNAPTAMEKYQVEGIPTLVVIDKKGRLRLYEGGFDPTPGTGTKEKLNDLVKKLLAEKA